MVRNSLVFCSTLAAGLVSASIAFATTFVFDDVAANTSMVPFEEDGISLEVTGGRCSPTLVTLCFAQDVTQTADGLGVQGLLDDDSDLDSFPGNEFLTFSFGTLVSLQSITFGDFNQPGDDNDEYELYVDLGMGLVEIADMGTDNPFNFGGILTDTLVVFAENSDIVTDFRDGFRVSSLTVAAVPLPATGLLLLAGLGGLGMIRRRSSKA